MFSREIHPPRPIYDHSRCVGLLGRHQSTGRARFCRLIARRRLKAFCFLETLTVCLWKTDNRSFLHSVFSTFHQALTTLHRNDFFSKPQNVWEPVSDFIKGGKRHLVILTGHFWNRAPGVSRDLTDESQRKKSSCFLFFIFPQSLPALTSTNPTRRAPGG